VGVTVNDSYSAFTFSPANPATPNMHSDMATLGLTFDEAISQRVTLRAYGAQSHLFSNLLPCSSFSGGLGMLFQPSRTLGVDLGAGPSTGCGAQSANFHGTVSGSLHKNQIHFYAGASRQLNTLYRLNSRWEDDAMGGVGRSFRSAELGFDGGYYHGQSLGLLAPSQGYFLSPRINYRLRLSRFTSVGLAYRRFHSAQPTGAGGDVSFVMVSVSFSPSPVPLER